MTRPDRLEIGIVLSSLGVLRGGLESTAVRLARGLVERGHAVDIVAGRGPRARPAAELDDLPVEWMPVACIPANHQRWSPVALRRPGWPLKAQSLSFVSACQMNRGVRKRMESWDVTLTALEIETVLVSRWRRRLHRPNLSLFPGIIDRDWLRRDRSNVRVAVSRGVAERMRSEPEIPIDGVVLSGAPDAWLDAPYTVRPEVRTLLFVGRLEPNKGVLELLSAFAAAARVFPRLRLRIAGEGPQDRIAREWIDRAGLSERVACLGSISHDRVHHEMRSADLLIFPSHHESFSQVLLEAAAVGVPVLASDIPGNREAVGETACLVPLGDEGRWVDAIRELTADHPRRQRMSAAGRSRARRFTSLQATERLEQFLRLSVSRVP